MRVTVIILLTVTGLNALAAGYGLMVDPTGKGLGMTREYLRFSPFENFLIPGITLFFAVGIVSVIGAILAIKKNRFYPAFTILEGCILTGWILVQVAMVRDFNLLHFIFLMVGLLLIFFGKKLLGK